MKNNIKVHTFKVLLWLLHSPGIPSFLCHGPVSVCSFDLMVLITWSIKMAVCFSASGCELTKFLFFIVFVSYVFNMSDLTAEELKAILDEKLAPIISKMCDIQNSMDLINEKYEEIKNRIALNEEVQKDIKNENQALKNQLRIATKEIDDLRATCNDLEQYSRRECIEIRGIPLPSKHAGSHSPGENTDLIVTKIAEVMELTWKLMKSPRVIG